MSLPRYEKYTSSGVDWIDALPSHWKLLRLKAKLKLRTERAERRTNPVALENIESWSGRFIPSDSQFEGDGVVFKRGDILFGKLRPYLAKVYLADSSGEAVGDFHVLNPSTDMDGRFVQYQMLSAPFIKVIDGSTFGSRMPRASWEALSCMPLIVPASKEQVAIASFLDSEIAKIDALITAQEKLIALLAEKRQATISRAVTRGLDSDVSMQDSHVPWLGFVPAHWDVKRLKQLVVESVAGPYGSSLTKSMYVSEGYRVYGQQQVIPDNFSIGDYYISKSKFADMERYRVNPGDVLISVMGTIGKAAVVPKDVEPGIINPRLVMYRVNIDLITPRYLQAFLNNDTSQRYFSLAAQGTTMEGLNMVSIGDLYVALPPKIEQEEILAFIRSVTEELDKLSVGACRAIELLKERRSALISAVVTGQIDVQGLVSQEVELSA